MNPTAPLQWSMGIAAFAARAVIATCKGPPAVDTLLLTVRLLLRSLPVVVIVTFFSGAMLTVQAAVSLADFGASSMSGMVVGFGGVREVFPLLAGGSLAARTGAELASQLQAMRVTKQVEALDMMGLDAVRLLVAPRVVACVIGGPVCVIAAMLSGLLGSYVIGVWQLNIDQGAMAVRLFSAVTEFDVLVGVFKGFVLGGLIGTVATYEGFCNDETGAQSVGRAANRAVIRSMVFVCITAMVLSIIIYGRLAV